MGKYVAALWSVSLIILIGAHSMLAINMEDMNGGINNDIDVDPQKFIEELEKRDPDMAAKFKKLYGSEDEQSIPVNGNTRLSVALYQSLASKLEPNENLIFSPLSISVAMSKLYVGAIGDTAEQMKEALSIPELEYAEDIIQEFEDVLNKLEVSEDSNKIHIASQVFADENIGLLENYQSQLEDNYGLKAEHFDFEKAYDTTINRVTEWITEATDNEIENVQISLKDNARMILADVFYIEPFWDKKFQIKNTAEDVFTLANGNKVRVPMMNQENKFYFGYIENYNVPFIELSSVGRKMTMFIFVLPLSDEKPKFEENLRPAYFANPKQAFRVLPMELNTQLSLPRFRLEQSYSIVGTLKKLGITDLFSTEADLSGLSEVEELFVGEVIHSAGIQIDEDGTNAPSAAINNVNMDKEQVKDVEFKVDRPFIFVVKESRSNNIVLMGKIQDPSSLAISAVDADKDEL